MSHRQSVCTQCNSDDDNELLFRYKRSEQNMLRKQTRNNNDYVKELENNNNNNNKFSKNTKFNFENKYLTYERFEARVVCITYII